MTQLLPGEKIDFSTLDSDSSDLTDDGINEKYARGEMRIVTEQARYPLNTISTMFDSGKYELNPEFQRRHRWSVVQQSRLVESFIMNVPVPPIFLYEDQYSHYEVMDGLQRITAIKALYADELVFDGLEEWPELNNRRYSTLPEQIQRGIDRRYLSSIILLRETAKNEVDAIRMKQLVFERINSGGLKLEPQETRNALYNGTMNRLCLKLGRNKYLCKMWRIPEPTVEEQSGQLSAALLEHEVFRTMKDAELVLRFFAQRQREDRKSGAMKYFLDDYLVNANKFPDQTIASLQQLFEQTISLVWHTLGDSAFFVGREKEGTWKWIRRPTTTVFDPMMAAFSEFVEEPDGIIENREKIRELIRNLYERAPQEFEGVYKNYSNFSQRTKSFRDILASIS